MELLLSSPPPVFSVFWATCSAGADFPRRGSSLPRLLPHSLLVSERVADPLGPCWLDAPAAILHAPGEAESGSAGVQPDKEYPGRRCADGALGSGWFCQPEPSFPHRTPELCLRKPNFKFSDGIASIQASISRTLFIRWHRVSAFRPSSKPCPGGWFQ